jgi:saccharopepsin
MILTTLAPLLLLPLATADRVHRLKLNKLQPVSFNPAFESAHLAEKYGTQSPQLQQPLMGAGGAGRRVPINRPGEAGGDDLFWTQELMKGGHGVPLSSGSDFILIRLPSYQKTDYMNAQYFAEINIGSPPQSVCSLVKTPRN